MDEKDEDVQKLDKVGQEDEAIDKSNCTQSLKTIQIDQELELLQPSGKQTEPRGDIMHFEKMFQNLQHCEKHLENNDKDMKMKLKTYEKNKLETEKKTADLERTIELLQKTVESLHNDLDYADKLIKENIDLKNTNKQLENDLETQTELTNQQRINYETLLNEEESRNKKTVDEMKEEMEKELSEKYKSFKEQIKEKQDLLENCQKEKESEIQKLTVDYENKISKLQRQKSTASLNQQQATSLNQEIFRKKLQHMKTEHEKEVNSLKEQNRQLLSQIANSPKLSGAHSMPSTSHPLFKKMRRY